jgi:hypothetical protein
MEQEKPITRRMAQEAHRAIEAALGSADEQAHFEVWGLRRTVRRSPEGWYWVEAPEERSDGRLFPASVSRLPGYPPDLPFVANELASVSGTRSAVLIWLAPEHPGLVFSSAVSQTIESGWVEESAEPRNVETGESRSFRKGELTRIVERTDAGMVSVFDLPRSASEGWRLGRHQ